MIQYSLPVSLLGCQPSLLIIANINTDIIWNKKYKIRSSSKLLSWDWWKCHLTTCCTQLRHCTMTTDHHSPELRSWTPHSASSGMPGDQQTSLLTPWLHHRLLQCSPSYWQQVGVSPQSFLFTWINTLLTLVDKRGKLQWCAHELGEMIN